jgi:sec-independent protein translocase protein TatC
MAEEKPSSDSGAAEPGSTFVAHLIELRNRLFYSVVAVAVAFLGLAVVFGPNQVYAVIARPLMETLPPNMSMIATEVASPFLTPIKFTLAAAVVIAIPVILYQVWAFVAPGLYQHERRVVMPLLVSSVGLFYGGMAFAYFIVFPAVFHVLLDFLPPGVQMMTDIKAYLDFVFSMFFAFGIAFEVPVAVVLLSWMGIVDPHKLGDKRPYVILGSFVVAAVLTPPDVLSQFLLAVPMWILYEIGVFVAKRLHRRPEAAQATGEQLPVASKRE